MHYFSVFVIYDTMIFSLKNTKFYNILEINTIVSPYLGPSSAFTQSSWKKGRLTCLTEYIIKKLIFLNFQNNLVVKKTIEEKIMNICGISFIWLFVTTFALLTCILELYNYKFQHLFSVQFSKFKSLEFGNLYL